jgi:DNA-binding response OmpR family regulator
MTNPDPRSILILEPDILIRHPLAEYLREGGYRVIETSSAVEAREVLGSAETRVDILFASAAGHDDGSFAIGSWARQRRPHLDVVLSGALRAATRKAAGLCEAGSAGVKPYEHRFLHDRIRCLLAARDRAAG